MSDAVSLADVVKLARLARLALPAEQAEAYRGQVAGILQYVDRLRALDVAGVEPMTHVGGGAGGSGGVDGGNRLDADVVREGFGGGGVGGGPEVVRRMSPASESRDGGVVVRVPGALDGGGA